MCVQVNRRGFLRRGCRRRGGRRTGHVLLNLHATLFTVWSIPSVLKNAQSDLDARLDLAAVGVHTLEKK